ncbi:MAG: ABC transporter ATP-binding protein [Candidatus Bipolaricaulia bacterium]
MTPTQTDPSVAMPTETPSTLLRVDGVSKAFDRVKAVSEVSLQVQQGEIFGLLGPNGAGKTTLIRMLLGIFRPDKGTIRVDIDGADQVLRPEIVGYLPEERGLYEDRRVDETLYYFATLHDMPADRARERALYWLDRLDLSDQFHSPLKELSKGMQQKVQFIVAVLHDPELVVLDEPFSGLDPPSQDLFQELIQELSDQGMTVLLSSHQMNFVESLCDRVFVIHRGEQVLYGDLAQIKRERGEDFVRLRYGEGDALELETWLHNEGHARIVKFDRGRVELVLPKGVSPNALLRGLIERVEIEELTVAKPSLHRIFVDIVGQEVES